MRVVLFMLAAGVALAQTGTQGPVVGMLNYIHATDDFDKTVAFYQEVFGLAKPNPPRPPNPAVPALVNAPGAQLKVAVFRIPGAAFGWELTYFGGIERKVGFASPVDPGAAHLMLRVRDLDAVLAAARKVGAPIVSRSGVPVKISSGEKGRSVFIRDPDGYLLEVYQLAGPEAGGDSNILDAAMGLTVSSMENTLKFYRELLGFELTGKMEFAANKAVTDVVGTQDGAQFRQMAGTVPGTKARIEFSEFKSVPRTPFRLRVPDPGCPALALGVRVVSAGGEPAQFSPTIRNIFVEDPGTDSKSSPFSNCEVGYVHVETFGLDWGVRDCGDGVRATGHPLSGTWSGDWGATATQRTQVTFVSELGRKERHRYH